VQLYRKVNRSGKLGFIFQATKLTVSRVTRVSLDTAVTKIRCLPNLNHSIFSNWPYFTLFSPKILHNKLLCFKRQSVKQKFLKISELSIYKPRKIGTLGPPTTKPSSGKSSALSKY